MLVDVCAILVTQNIKERRPEKDMYNVEDICIIYLVNVVENLSRLGETINSFVNVVIRKA